MNNADGLNLAKSIESAAKTYIKDICCGKPIMFKIMKKSRFYRCGECGHCYYDYVCGWCKDTGAVPHAVWVDNKPVEKVAICQCPTAVEKDFNNHKEYKNDPPFMAYYFASQLNKAPVSRYHNLVKFKGQDDEYNYQYNLQNTLMAWRHKHIKAPELKRRPNLSGSGEKPYSVNFEFKYHALMGKYKGLLETAQNQGSAKAQN